jgi:two-component system sensor histidine kinase/response regulator
MTTSNSDVNLLVVDDVPQNLLAMEALLTRPGVKVLRAASGAEALELLLNHDVAVALLDVQMPELDGFGLAELMRGAARTRHIPIMFLTAASQDTQRTFRGYEAGAVDFLYKPVEAHVLGSKVAVFIDLYVQRQRLKEQINEVQRLRRLNEMMAAVLTHDLRTPLMAITLSAEIVHRRGHDEAIQKAGARIKSSSSRMARTIDHMLNFSRVRAKVPGIVPQHSDLAAACAAAVAEIQTAQPDAVLNMHTEGDLFGVFDSDRMTQVFSNLIGNAMEQDPSAAITVRLDGAHKDRISVHISTPAVLPDEAQGRLFESIRTSTPGTVVQSNLSDGLTLVDQFISAHGGSIVGRSTLAEGTVFEFMLPRGEVPPAT